MAPRHCTILGRDIRYRRDRWSCSKTAKEITYAVRTAGMKRNHRMPFGAECREDGGVRFRLWAPKAQSVDVVLADESRPLSLSRQSEGWFELCTTKASAGAGYRIQIDGQLNVPDPASRFQPSDVHGASQV